MGREKTRDKCATIPDRRRVLTVARVRWGVSSVQPQSVLKIYHCTKPTHQNTRGYEHAMQRTDRDIHAIDGKWSYEVYSIEEGKGEGGTVHLRSALLWDSG